MGPTSEIVAPDPGDASVELCARTAVKWNERDVEQLGDPSHPSPALCPEIRPHARAVAPSPPVLSRHSEPDRYFSGSFPHAIDRAMPPAAAQLSMRRGTGPLGLAPLDDC